MRKNYLHAIRIVALLFVLTAAIFVGSLFTVSAVASATTTYDLGHLQVTINLTYGANVDEPIRYAPNDPTKLYRVKTFNASSTIGGATFSLTEGGKVSAEPGTYYLAANGNAVPCYDTGSEIPDANCSGLLLVEVSRNSMVISVPAETFTKSYGDEPAKPVWSEDTLSVTFETTGRAATAAVGEYPVSIDAVTLGGKDVKAYYDITTKIAETAAAATYTVLPKEVVIDYPATEEVRFNDYLLADGTSVTKRVLAGENGETLTAYYRLKEPVEGSLAVGASYEIEMYRYEVKPAAGAAVSYAVTDVSNYAVTAQYTANSVKAKAGYVIVYQDESLVATRQNDARYLYLPLSTFTYTYLDLVMTDIGEVMMSGEILYPTVTFYPGVTGTVRCLVTGAEEGNIPVGSYPMSLVEYTCPEIESLSFENVSLVVTALTLEEPYAGKDEAEITVSDTFVKRVTRTYKNTEFAFDLTADLTDKAVGAEVAYTAVTAVTDPNVRIEYGEARVTVVKRKSGVSLAAESPKSAVFGDDLGSLAVPYLEDAVLESGAEVRYRYHAVGAEAVFEGVPSLVGAYVVTCSLVSDLYEIDPVEVELTIAKRRVAARYTVSATQKTYGQTFAYKTGTTVRIVELYPVDRAGEEDRTQTVEFKASDFSGVILSSDGFAAGADVGTYDFVATGAMSPSFEIVKAIVFEVQDDGSQREVNKFTVNKAAAPPPPEATCRVTNNREIKVTAEGAFNARIARNDRMTSPTEESGEGSVTFTKVGGKKPFCGEVFYVSVSAEAGENYENASGWSEPIRVEIPFTAPAVTVSSLASDGATFTYTPLPNAVEGYVVKYRVGNSGEWKDSASTEEWTVKATGLHADTSYTVNFRAEKDGVTGASSSVEIRTLRAAVEKEKVKPVYDRLKKTLTVETEEEGLEYSLYTESGEVISEWGAAPNFEEVLADSEYVLKIRYAEDEDTLSSEVTEIKIDTHKAKEPLTFRGVLRDWFLANIGFILLVLMIVFIVIFVKKKRKIDREGA